MNTALISTEYKHILRSSVLFRALDGAELEQALALFGAEPSAYAKGELVHPPYTPMKRFGLVLSGTVQAGMDDREGSRMIMAEVVPGGTFGESLCFLSSEDSPVYVTASEPSELLWLSPEVLFDEPRDALSLRLQKQFTAMLAARTLAMNDRIQVLSKLRLRDKLMTYFTQLSRRTGEMTFQLPLNREDLAAYVGTNRSALSRELARMKREGLIDYYRNTIRLLG